jgi:signal transduction histidine kinase
MGVEASLLTPIEQWLSGNFMPHGHCYLWSPSMVWLQLLSNLFIGLAYLSISGTLYFIIRRIKDIPFSWMYLAFGVFIITCGVTHFMDVVTIWHPVYWLDGSVRAVTAVASVGTALMLFPLVPKAIGLAEAAQVAHARGLELEKTYAELTQAHEKSQELERLKAQFFANVSHELRTPLTLVLGPAEKLAEAPNLTEEQRRDLAVITRNARTVLKHVEDLLDVSRLEVGKVDVEYARTDAAKLVRMAAAHFDSFALERKMSFDVRAPESLPTEIDEAKVQRVVLNLLSNAFKFTPDGGTVRCAVDLVTRDKKEYVRLQVADSGPGVAAEMRDLIFERFAQGEGGSTRRFGGTGLGLAIAREFVELHGGTIAVSAAPEGGACFTVELPAKAPEGATLRDEGPATEEEKARAAGQAVEELRTVEPLADEPAPDTNRSRVLVIEDNREMNAFVCETLGETYAVYRAYDGAEGVEKARSLRPDLVVSDVMMPRMSGDEVVTELRKLPELASTAIVLLTAKADDALRTRLLREGAQDYLMKPFSREELRARVDNLVAVKRARDVMQRELESRSHDVDALASELGARKRELEEALVTVEIARDEAERASQLKTNFLGLISHELRTPLTSLQLLLDRLSAADGELSAKNQQNLSRMMAATERLTDLVDSLLQYARVQSGKVTAHVERFDARELVRTVFEELKPQAQRKSLTFELEEPSGPVKLKSDPKLLRVVLANLVANALKFTEQGKVAVSLTADTEGATIRVRDTGPGIAAEDQARVFEPFHQLEPTRHKHLPGVGLGLSLVREIVDNLGGTVMLESTPGEGTTFTLRMPFDAAKPPPKE